MNKADAIIRLVHLLPALAAAAHEGLVEVTLIHPEHLHALEKLAAFLRRNRHGKPRFQMQTSPLSGSPGVKW